MFLANGAPSFRKCHSRCLLTCLARHHHAASCATCTVVSPMALAVDTSEFWEP